MKQMIDKVGKSLPPLNDYLINNFRKEKIDQIPEYLDAHFRNVIKPLFGCVEYEGYKVLSPLEEAEWRLKESPEERNINISFSTNKVVRYTLRMEDTHYYMYIRLPFMDPAQRCIYYQNTEYYPLFIITERLVRAHKNTVTIKVAQSVFTFYRNIKHTIKSTDGQVFREYVVTAKLHKHSGSGKKEPPPIILYHLVQFGFSETLQRYGFAPDDITVCNKEVQEEGIIHFELPGKKFLRVKENLITDGNYISVRNNIRILISLIRIFKVYRNYSVEDIYDPSRSLFFIILGFLISKSKKSPPQVSKYAKDHYKTYSIMLDPTAKQNFCNAGYPCNETADLLFHTFWNIDKWLIESPNNLFGKQFSIMELTVSRLIEQITREIYNTINSDKNKAGITHKTVQKFVKRVSNKNPYWFQDVCRIASTNIHNNWLMTIGLKYERHYQAKQGKKNIPMSMMVSHYSWVTATSLISLPSGKPVSTGTINPYCPIDSEGIVQKHPFSDEISDIFD